MNVIWSMKLVIVEMFESICLIAFALNPNKQNTKVKKKKIKFFWAKN